MEQPPPPPPPPPPGDVAPLIRMTAYTADHKGVDAWFADTDVANVAALINRFFLSLGFRFARGGEAEGEYTYGRGYRVQTYGVAVSSHMGSTHLVVTRVTASGGNTRTLGTHLGAFLADPGNLTQRPPQRAPDPAVVPVPAQPQRSGLSAVLGGGSQPTQSSISVGGVVASVLVFFLVFFLILVLVVLLGNSGPLNNSVTGSSSTNGSGGGSGGGSVPGASSDAQPAAATCVKTNVPDNSDWYMLTDSTSTTPCYAHWTITMGPGCRYLLNGVEYASPANVWNITEWSYQQGETLAYLQDGNLLQWTCVINVHSYPQTSLNPQDWH